MIAISDTPATVAVGGVSQTAIMVAGTRQIGQDSARGRNVTLQAF
jgi:hypothetical protein